MPTAPPTRRRWFQFGLGTLFVVMTIFAALLSWQLSIVRERRATIKRLEAVGGYAVTSADAATSKRPLKFQGTVPIYRLWLGDVAVARFRVPSDCEEEFRDYQKLFPEADKPHFFYPVRQN